MFLIMACNVAYQRPSNLLHLLFAIQLLHQSKTKLDRSSWTLAGDCISVDNDPRVHRDHLCSELLHERRITGRLQ